MMSVVGHLSFTGCSEGVTNSLLSTAILFYSVGLGIGYCQAID